MIKKASIVVCFGMIFLLIEALLINARAGNTISGTDRQRLPNAVQIQQKEMSSISGQDKESSQSPDQLLEEIRRIEYDEIQYDKESLDYFGFIKGKIPILISAPHGAEHFRRRENRWKGEDEYTASLAIELGKLTGAYVIYVKNKTWEDPNNDPSSKYKKAVAKAVKQYHIKFLMDLHGSDERRPYKVDIGIISNQAGRSSCPTYKKIIQEAFSGFEPKIFNQKFCANDACTMTFFAKNELGIQAAQIEINAKYRIVDRKPDSAKAKAGIEPHFKANGKDVLALITRLERMIVGIDRIVENNTLSKYGAFKS